MAHVKSHGLGKTQTEALVNAHAYSNTAREAVGSKIICPP